MAELTTDTTATSSCCASEAQASGCEPPEDAACCSVSADGGSCGCSEGPNGEAVSATGSETPAGSSPSTRRVELYEPAMCCQTGVCGPSVDQQLIDVREDLRWAESRGVDISRHNLSSDPDAFVVNPKVTGLMAAFGEAALPVLVVDGDIAIHGHYPSREELAGLLSLECAVEPPQSSGGCGCGPTGC
jgi:hypothetical protein